jgi:hypothetical protein
MHKSRLERLDLNADERQIEELLGGLRSTKPRFTIQSVRASAAMQRQRRQVWWWRGVSTALAASLAIALWPHRTIQPAAVERIVYVQADKSPLLQPNAAPTFYAVSHDSPDLDSSDAYLAVRQRVIGRGMPGLISPEALMQRAAHPSKINAPMQKTLPAMEPSIGREQQSGPIPLLLRMMERETKL